MCISLYEIFESHLELSNKMFTTGHELEKDSCKNQKVGIFTSLFDAFRIIKLMFQYLKEFLISFETW